MRGLDDVHHGSFATSDSGAGLRYRENGFGHSRSWSSPGHRRFRPKGPNRGDVRPRLREFRLSRRLGRMIGVSGQSFTSAGTPRLVSATSCPELSDRRAGATDRSPGPGDARVPRAWWTTLTGGVHGRHRSTHPHHPCRSPVDRRRGNPQRRPTVEAARTGSVTCPRWSSSARRVDLMRLTTGTRRLVLVTLVVALPACSGGSTSTASRPGRVGVGERLAESFGCFACHGIYGTLEA